MKIVKRWGIFWNIVAVFWILTAMSSAINVDVSDGAVQIDGGASLRGFLTSGSEVYGTLTADFTYDTDTFGVMDISAEKVLDFSDFTVTVPDNVKNKSRIINLKSMADLTIYDGTIVCGTASEAGAYGAISSDGECDARLLVKNMTFCNTRADAQCLKLWDLAQAVIQDSTFYATNGGAIVNCNSGGSDGIVLENCTMYQTSVYNYNSVAVGVVQGNLGNSIVYVYEGTYVSDGYGAYVMSSGGDLYIYGGNWQGKTSVLTADSEDSGTKSTIYVYGGAFDGPIKGSGDGASIVLYGGTFSGTNLSENDFSNFLAEGCTATEMDGVFTVTPEAIVVDEGGTTTYYGTLSGAISVATEGDTVTLCQDGTLSVDAIISEGVTLEIPEFIIFTVASGATCTVFGTVVRRGTVVGDVIYALTISFDGNGGTTSVDTLTTEADGTLGQLPTASRSGYTFTGWQDGDGNAVTTDTGFFTNTTLIATWSKNATVSNAGTKVTTTASSDEEAEVAEEITEEITEESISKTVFSDVETGKYYTEAVEWAVEQGIATGKYDDSFAPEDEATRADVLTLLYRGFGAPEVAAGGQFDDVDGDSYYGSAVAWAVEWGITQGMAGGQFGTEEICTRGQIVTFLWRAAGTPAVEGTHNFGDVAVGTYYETALIWALEQGITNGTSDATFSPDEPCTRGQIVTFLYRFLA